MKRILNLFIAITLLMVSGTAFAGGKVGRITQVMEISEDYYDVYFTEDTNASGPSSGDEIYQLDTNDFDGKGLLELFRFAVDNNDKYNCYINNGGYQSSGGQQSVAFAQLVERPDGRIEGVERRVNSLERRVNSLEQSIKSLTRLKSRP